MLGRNISKLGVLINRFPVIIYLIIAVFAATLFFWIQAAGNLPDPDSFYHARMAELIARRGPVHDFPWLAKTVFVDSYVDHHFLYHVLLIPFIKIWGLAAGIRLSSIFFAVSVILAAVWLLRRLGVGRVAYLVPFFLLASYPFIFRINLAKAPALSLLLLFLGFYAALRAKPFLLGLTAFVYVWLYDGWIILPVAVVLVIFADTIVPERAGTPTEERGWHWSDRLWGKKTKRILAALVLGLGLGHLINPYFPKNFIFEWIHIVKIGLLGVGFRAQLGVGAEWFPYEFFDLFGLTFTTFFALLLGGVAFFAALMQSRESRQTIPRERVCDTAAFFLFAALAWFFTLRAKRHVEYFVPFAALAAVSAWDLFLRQKTWSTLKTSGRALFGRKKIGLIVLAFYLALLIPFVVFRDWRTARRDFDNGFSPNKFAGAANWLRQNTPEGALIFHNDWDDFNYFFIQNTHNRFLVALDPTFMYLKYPELYREWVEITQSRTTDRLAERIKDDFGASYAFVDAEHPRLKASLDAEPRLKPVYFDKEGTIYEVLDNVPR